jgi:hypothetical protein
MARVFDFFRRGGAGRDDSEPVRHLALAEIKRTWSVDEADVTPTEFGFDWLPGSHLVHVRIHEDAREPIGAVRFRITISTEYLRSVPVHDHTFVEEAGVVAGMFSPTYSQVYPPSELVKTHFNGRPADMELFSSAYVYDDTVEWISGFLARMSIMQPINAEILSRGEKLVGSGTPALVNGSIRPTVNGVLNIHRDLLIPEGKEPSRWTGSEEFEAYIEERGKSDICFGFSNQDGMSFETPFGSNSALVKFNADQSDRQLGNGLTIETHIPLTSDLHEVCEHAAWLNYYESVLWTDFPQFGRWHPLMVSEEQASLVHTIFIPNAYFRDGLVVNFALWAIARVGWTREKLLPKEKDLTMIEILEQRFGRSFH